MAFVAAGCRVEMVCPSNHPVLLTRGVSVRHSLRALAPITSLHAAIRKAEPDLVVPTDETATSYLYRLYEEAPEIDQESTVVVRSLLRRSLGHPSNFSLYSSRTSFLEVAQAEGIPTVPTQDIPDRMALDRWLSSNSLPAVLKADETSGGEGVKIVCTRREAIRAWRKLRAPLGVARVIKKTSSEHDPHHIIPWITRRRRTVSIQPFITGQDSNVAAACWKGELLGAISMDVLRTWRPKGPAALVELSQDDQMIKAARAMVQRLNLSGLCGFDFIVEDGTGKAYLIELNARATQTCHLPYGVPRDLITSLVAALVGRPLPPTNDIRRRGIIALFPLAWQSGVTKEVLASTIQDIPWEEPLLVKAGLARKNKSLYERWMQMWARINTSKHLAGESK